MSRERRMTQIRDRLIWISFSVVLLTASPVGAATTEDSTGVNSAVAETTTTDAYLNVRSGESTYFEDTTAESRPTTFEATAVVGTSLEATATKTTAYTDTTDSTTDGRGETADDSTGVSSPVAVTTATDAYLNATSVASTYTEDTTAASTTFEATTAVDTSLEATATKTTTYIDKHTTADNTPDGRGETTAVTAAKTTAYIDKQTTADSTPDGRGETTAVTETVTTAYIDKQTTADSTPDGRGETTAVTETVTTAYIDKQTTADSTPDGRGETTAVTETVTTAYIDKQTTADSTPDGRGETTAVAETVTTAYIDKQTTADSTPDGRGETTAVTETVTTAYIDKQTTADSTPDGRGETTAVTAAKTTAYIDKQTTADSTPDGRGETTAVAAAKTTAYIDKQTTAESTPDGRGETTAVAAAKTTAYIDKQTTADSTPDGRGETTAVAAAKTTAYIDKQTTADSTPDGRRETTAVTAAKTTAYNGKNTTTDSTGETTTTAVPTSVQPPDSRSTTSGNTNSRAQLLSEALFEFGYSTGDYGLFGDDSLAYLYLSRGFPTDKSSEDTVYISTNGYIAIGRSVRSYKPKKFPYRPNSRRSYQIVAPFWADATTYYYPPYHYYSYYYYYYYYFYNYFRSRVYYQVYTDGKSRYGDDQTALFSRVNEIISRKNNLGKFYARWILKVTWYNMLQPFGSHTNTFQCILATDYWRSYAIFLYQDGGMTWPLDSLSYAPRIGYQMGPDKFYNDRRSGQPEAFRIDQEKGNLKNYKGLFVFRLDSNEGEPDHGLRCLDWYESQSNSDFRHIQELDVELSDCPCTLWQAFFDPRFIWAWFEREYWEGNYCFYTILPPRGFRGSRKCCYRLQRVWWYYDCCGWYWRYFFSLNTDPVTGGGLIAYSKLFRRSFRRYVKYDKVPHTNCCLRSGLCSLYRVYRPLSNCLRYVQLQTARFRGDPHVTTLDGLGYTFNGYGEYVVLSVPGLLMIQGRTERATNKDGNLTDATVFTAFAAKDLETNATVQVELNRNKTDLVVYCNGEDHTVTFQNRSADFSVLYDDLGCNRPANKTLGVTFTSGLSTNISIGVELLEISVTIPKSLEGKVNTSGLLGVYNSDPSDDFTRPDGTIILANSTEKEIFDNFGQLWMVNDSTTVFTYRSGDGASNHSHPEFRPKFLSDFDADKVKKAKEICGDNNQCVFDYLTTDREDVATSTKDAVEADKEEKTVNDNSAPSLDVQQTIRAIVGELVRVPISATDADGDNVTIYLGQNITGFNNLTQSGNSAILLWKPESLDPVVVQISGNDASNTEAPSITPTVLLCSGCSGHGECEFNTTEASVQSSANNSATFVAVRCTCNMGWTGEDCSEDQDGCADEPCPTGSTCADLTPEEQQAQNGTAFNCSGCPQGTTEVLSKCIDVDECNATEAVCGQHCVNTDGSYTCHCSAGYALGEDNHACIDNDECATGTNNCSHICKNIDGGYNCSCREGYISEDDGVTCEVDPDDDPCAGTSLACHHGCVRENGETKCFCRNGYVLENDRDCVDLDECREGVCEQSCSNTDGGYSCSCRTGFLLKDDMLSCEECSPLYYGVNCAMECDCSEYSSECHNVRGCVCKPGWTGSDCATDVDECLTVECGKLQTCTNQPGHYECSCMTGYRNVNGQCTDIDECSDDDLNDCEYDCVNGVGSYLCKCAEGYTGDGTNCTDIDECVELVPDCEHKCRNTDGGYTCECYRGFTLDDDRKHCVDVDKLCDGVTTCDQICTVDDTTLEIVCLCNPGYVRNNDACQDIDECLENVCDGGCENSPGGYTCTCSTGSKLAYDRKTCEVCDRFHWGDDCAKECGCGPGGTCNATLGCVCDPGWQGDTCNADILECQIAGTCADDRVCVELAGSYRCDCLQGYRLNGTECIDIDECSESTHDCDQECVNQIGSFACVCGAGFRDIRGDGRECADIDECSEGNLCEAVCVNAVGGYDCSCHAGFDLAQDRITCEKDPDSGLCGNCSYSCNSTSCLCPREHALQSDGTSCAAQRYRVRASITLDVPFTASLNVTYSDDFKATVHDIQEALRLIYRDLPYFSAVIVLELREGSVIAQHYVVFISPVSPEATQGVISSLYTAYTGGTLLVGGRTVGIPAAPFLVTDSGQFLVTQPLSCAAEPCDFGYVCCDNGAQLQCERPGSTCETSVTTASPPQKPDTSNAQGLDDTNALALGLGLGIPLCLLAAIALIFILKKMNERESKNDVQPLRSEGSRSPSRNGSPGLKPSPRVGPLDF